MAEVKKKKSKDNKLDEIKLLTEEVRNLEDKLLRNQAELINFKRRKEEDIKQLLKYNNLDLIKNLLPIIDNFERAVNMDDDDLTDEVSRFLEGFKLIYSDFRRLLTSIEVNEIESLGKPFDPNYHEAVMVEEVKDKEPEIILEVLQKGYLYKDKVIRPAMVKVNKNK